MILKLFALFIGWWRTYTTMGWNMATLSYIWNSYYICIFIMPGSVALPVLFVSLLDNLCCAIIVFHLRSCYMKFSILYGIEHCGKLNQKLKKICDSDVHMHNAACHISYLQPFAIFSL